MHFGALAMNPRSEVHAVTERSPDSSGAKRLSSGAATSTPLAPSPKCLQDRGRMQRIQVDGSEQNGAT